MRCVTRSLLLRARLADARGRIALLDEAYAVAEAASDHAHQVTVLTRLVQAHWATGDRIATLAALDRLAEVAGVGEAAAACPPELADELAAARPLLASRQP